MNWSAASTHGRWAFGLTVAAFCWALALVPAALLVPVYEGTTSSDLASVTHQSATLVGENGPMVLAIVAVPAVLASIAWFGLHRRCAHASPHGTALAWAAIGSLLLLSVLASLSIGYVFLPAALMLVVAATLTPTG